MIRYYEHRGRIRSPSRGPRAHRNYAEDDIERCGSSELFSPPECRRPRPWTPSRARSTSSSAGGSPHRWAGCLMQRPLTRRMDLNAATLARLLRRWAVGGITAGVDADAVVDLSGPARFNSFDIKTNAPAVTMPIFIAFGKRTDLDDLAAVRAQLPARPGASSWSYSTRAMASNCFGRRAAPNSHRWPAMCSTGFATVEARAGPGLRQFH